MPKLWEDTIEAHRQQVRDAILETTAELVSEHGILVVTMSQIAEGAGIGRATLYKYFSGVEEILHAWHQRQVAGHLRQLEAVRDRTADDRDRFEAVLACYARTRHDRGQHHRRGPHARELATFVHRDEHMGHAEQQLRALVRDVLAEAASHGAVRDDTSPGELATYCLHALDAARSLPTEAAVRRLVDVVVAGLRPPGRGTRRGA